MPRALLSVSDKRGLVELGGHLVSRGFEIISTGGSARVLTDAGLPVVSVASLTGFPEMMDGRVKTLHPKIHAGILARRHRPDDLEALAAHDIGLIDLVAVNLYPFAKAAAAHGIPLDRLLEEIDIGGPTLVRAAAKNFRDVLVIVDPADYPAVLGEIDRATGPSLAFRFDLARKAFAHTAAYDETIARVLAGRVSGDSDVWGSELYRAVQHPGSGLSPESSEMGLRLEKVRDLRYGENPHQRGSLWAPAGQPAGLTLLQGKELSFTNLLDLDAAWRLAGEFDEPAAAVVKHTNPCGAATGASPADAYTCARDADAQAAFGGIVGLNRPIDRDVARAIASTFIEAVITPAVAGDALGILAAKRNMRVVTLTRTARGAGHHEPRLIHEPPAIPPPIPIPPPIADRWWHTELRSVFGGWLCEERDQAAEAWEAWPRAGFPEVVTRRQPSADEWVALRFAWRVAAHVKSNAVVFTGLRQTVAIGAGQMSRVDAVKVAVMKARALGRSLEGAVAASDAFFPFRDGLDAIAEAGATAVVQPGGSVRDAEVIAAADERGLAMVFTGRRHFRH